MSSSCRHLTTRVCRRAIEERLMQKLGRRLGAPLEFELEMGSDTDFGRGVFCIRSRSSRTRPMRCASSRKSSSARSSRCSNTAPSTKPFGGVKCSGIGVEFNVDGLKEYTTVQVVNAAR
jgi:acyl-CoA reductase-like NAD-dependent aldehyde dehydrogenase